MNQKQLEKLQELGKKHPEVKELLEEYNKFLTDPGYKLYTRLTALVDNLCADIDELQTNESRLKLLSGNKDDKLFERVMAIYKQSDDIFSALLKGKKYVNPDAEEEGKKEEKQVII